jgi:hypothetical protein
LQLFTPPFRPGSQTVKEAAKRIAGSGDDCPAGSVPRNFSIFYKKICKKTFTY